MRKEIRTGTWEAELTFEELYDKYKSKINYAASKSYDRDEMVQIGIIELWKSYMAYLPEFSFNTYFYARLKWAYATHMRQSKPKFAVISMEQPIGYGKDGGELCIEDLLQADDPGFERVDYQDFIHKICRRLCKRENELLLDIIQDTRKNMGVSTVIKSMQKSRLLEKIRMLYLEGR